MPVLNARIALIYADSPGRPCDTPQYHPPPTGTTRRLCRHDRAIVPAPEGTVLLGLCMVRDREPPRFGTQSLAIAKAVFTSTVAAYWAIVARSTGFSRKCSAPSRNEA